MPPPHRPAAAPVQANTPVRPAPSPRTPPTPRDGRPTGSYSDRSSASPRPASSWQPARRPAAASPKPQPAGPPKIADAIRGASPSLFETGFDSVGPRRYDAAIKRASNGNPYLVLTESKPVEGQDEPRRTRLLVFSEDFDAFFDMLADLRDASADFPTPPRKRRFRKG